MEVFLSLEGKVMEIFSSLKHMIRYFVPNFSIPKMIEIILSLGGIVLEIFLSLEAHN